MSKLVSQVRDSDWDILSFLSIIIIYLSTARELLSTQFKGTLPLIEHLYYQFTSAK